MPIMAAYIMDCIEDFVLEDDEEATFWNKDAVAVYEEDHKWTFFSCNFMIRVFPIRVVAIAVVAGVFMGKYYFEGCHSLADGSIVANNVHLPKTDILDIFAFLFGPIPGLFAVETGEKPVWQYSPGHPNHAFDLPAG